MRKPGFSAVKLRNIVQVLFVVISLYIGWRFVNYYTYLATAGASGSPVRPPGVEAFVPLSALVGLRAWIGTGVFDWIHPAGLTILVTALVIAFLFRKSFCSWICPFGFLEEMLARVGLKIKPKRLVMPRWLDIMLRGVKYVLLGLFIGGVFLLMDGQAAAGFLELPYNKVVDIKMLVFFLNISVTGIAVFIFLIIMSVLFDHFWCRYLCPYGALLGLLGWFSPSRISRNTGKCVNCGACDKACPSRLKVSAAPIVLSPECNSCMSCVDSCPVDGALEYNFAGRLGGSKYILPAAMLGVFVLAVVIAKFTGHWDSSTTLQEVNTLFSVINQI